MGVQIPPSAPVFLRKSTVRDLSSGRKPVLCGTFVARFAENSAHSGYLRALVGLLTPPFSGGVPEPEVELRHGVALLSPRTQRVGSLWLNLPTFTTAKSG